MKIKHVEELVGITRKNIRFYEEQGLLSPDRAENGYREYRQADVERLMKIKLLRKLGIPIEQIGLIFEGKLNLDNCLDRHVDVLEKQKENLVKMQMISRQMADTRKDIRQLDVESYLEIVEKMEKEGMQFMDVGSRDVKRKKRFGAIAAAVVMIVFLTAMLAIILWANSIDPAPKAVIALPVVLLLVTLVGTVIAVIGRVKEIEGGEEDEASKY